VYLQGLWGYVSTRKESSEEDFERLVECLGHQVAAQIPFSR
jgi:hypothetical protein